MAALATLGGLFAFSAVTVPVPSPFLGCLPSWWGSRGRGARCQCARRAYSDATHWHLPLNIVAIILNIKSAIVMLCKDLRSPELALLLEVRLNEAACL